VLTRQTMTATADQCEPPLFSQVRALGERGELEQALRLVTDALREHPEEPSVESLANVLSPSTISQLGLARLKAHIVGWARFAASVPIGAGANAAQLANVHWAAELVGRVRRVFSDEPQLYVAESLLRRRDPDRETALAVASEGAERFSEVWPCMTALMHALADAGELDRALAAAHRALALEPADGSPLNDIACAFFNAGRKDEAAALFAELERRFPGYPSALR